jgi:LPS-assembly lipoprotein
MTIAWMTIPWTTISRMTISRMTISRMTISRMTISRMTVAVMLFLGIAGCGFQLRGEVPTGLTAVHVSTAVPSQVAVEIRRQLASGPTKLAANVKESEAHVRILEENTEKLIQSLTGAGRVFDYQLRLNVRFQVTDAAEKMLVEPALIELQRIITYSESAPLAKEAEERLLYDEMRAEVAARILRRTAVVRAGAATR